MAELSVPEKVVENRLRAAFDRRGLRLTRSRQRDGAVVGSYGVWSDQEQVWIFAGPLGWGRSLTECEEFLHQVANGAAPQSETT